MAERTRLALALLALACAGCSEPDNAAEITVTLGDFVFVGEVRDGDALEIVPLGRAWYQECPCDCCRCSR